MKSERERKREQPGVQSMFAKCENFNCKSEPKIHI